MVYYNVVKLKNVRLKVYEITQPRNYKVVKLLDYEIIN